MDLEKIRKLKEQREEKAVQDFSSELKYTLKPGFNVLRLVGDPEICLQAWIKQADGKNHPYIFEADGIMMELINSILDYTMEQKSDGKFARRYTYEGTDIFQIIKSQRWMPREVYLFNCIPRELQKDPSANQMVRLAEVKNHTLLLTQSKAGIGIGPMLFESIAGIIDNFGDAETYDIVVSKSGSGFDTVYDAQMAVAKNNNYGERVAAEGALSAKELEYEKYDLSLLIQPTPIKSVLTTMGDSIKLADSVLSSNFYQRLSEAAKKEVAPEEVSTVAEEVPKQFSRRKKVTEEVDPIAASFPKGAVLEPCEKCGKKFPDNESKCPYCGQEYDVV